MQDREISGFHEYGEYSIKVNYDPNTGEIKVAVLDALDDAIETIHITNA